MHVSLQQCLLAMACKVYQPLTIMGIAAHVHESTKQMRKPPVLLHILKFDLHVKLKCMYSDSASVTRGGIMHTVHLVLL
jgi:hypothetical protein